MKKSIFVLFLTFHNLLCGLDPVILLFGPPGAGKGTFSQFAKELGYDHLSAGDAIRDEILNRTAIGLRIEENVKKGDRIDSDLFWQFMLQKILDLRAQDKPFIIDGLGRTVQGIEKLCETICKLHLENNTWVIFIDTPDEICKERVAGRLICNDCHHVYSRKNGMYPNQLCTHCGVGILQKRIDDTQEVIEKRIASYRAGMETNYKKCLELFPALFLDGDRDENECLASYVRLLVQLKECQYSQQFVELEINLCSGI